MLTERANAKINLYLDVLSRRANGYHNIVSLMQSVSLCDLVSVDFYPEASTNLHLEASGNPRMPTDCRNLAWRAAELFLKESRRSGRVLIRIEKHIPMEAGLAGGSTDAAAVLRALNRLCGAPFSTEELCAIAARLGADVPFCVLGGAALVEGIGEQLTRLPSMPRRPLVVACMGEGVSTPWAYGRLDERYADFDPPRVPAPSLSRLVESLREGRNDLPVSHLFNLFAPVVEAERPAVLALRRRMEEEGAEIAMMSGSGPSVFGCFSNLEQAAAACDSLRAMGAEAYVCHPMSGAV